MSDANQVKQMPINISISQARMEKKEKKASSVEKSSNILEVNSLNGTWGTVGLQETMVCIISLRQNVACSKFMTHPRQGAVS